MRRPRYSQERVIQAIREHDGLLTLAADALECHRNTLANYAQRSLRVRAALQDARERRLDAAERQLFSAVDRGELPAIMFYLRTIGRRRGYGDRLELEGQIDVLTHPQWLRTRAVLLDVLAHHPEARTAVVTRLRALEASAEGQEEEDDDTG